MERDRKLIAVVPAFNEGASVGSVVDSLRTRAPEFDVLVVDDGSTDDTSARAVAAGARVVQLPFNLGIGGAVQTGFIYADEHGYDYMVQVDGDGQHEADELGKLVTAMRSDPSLDVVCGSRFLTDAADRYPAPFGRRTGIQLFAFVLSRIVRDTVTDPTSGFRLYNRRAIRLFAADYPPDYPEVEAVLMMHANRLRMTEVPVRMRTRGTGRSSITGRRSAYYMVKVSLALLVALLRRQPTIEKRVSVS
jgi:glycosyltransferase involved in cell wall biosynthesis